MPKHNCFNKTLRIFFMIFSHGNHSGQDLGRNFLKSSTLETEFHHISGEDNNYMESSNPSN